MRTKGSTLVNKIYLENTMEIIRECLICQERFKTTIGGPHICSRRRCQKIHNGYRVPRIYPVHLPENLASIEEILSSEQTEEEV